MEDIAPYFVGAVWAISLLLACVVASSDDTNPADKVFYVLLTSAMGLILGILLGSDLA